MSTSTKSSASAMQTGNSGNTSVTSTGVTSSSTTKPAVCNGLSETQCLGAFPECVPLYDDACCPTCAPGPCGDCSHMEFYECLPANEACSGQPVVCGFVAKEHCGGAPAICTGGYCPSMPGCTEACKPDASGMCVAFECHAITKGTCTSVCDGIPPACPPGFTAEQDGGCYTGFCIEDQICLP